MALLAVEGKVRPRQRKVGRVVVEAGVVPVLDRMTHLAVGRIHQRHVVGIVHQLVVGPVTRVAVRRRVGIALLVAALTVQGRVRAGQGEVGQVVVEVGVVPVAGIVADLALEGIVVGEVVVGHLVVGPVTGVAVRGRIGVALRVTALAIHGDMRPGQREIGPVVVEVRIVPVTGVVAHLALGGELAADVIGIVGGLVVLAVAGVAVRGGPGESVVVATGAVEGNVRPRQREIGQVVIKAGRRPGGFGMAVEALG